jgi:hypothetical protein
MSDNSQRGATMITVIVILLMLSAIGMAAIYMTEREQRVAGTDINYQQALYVAEAGLRRGESVLNAVNAMDVDSVLQHPPSASTPAVSPGVPTFPQSVAAFTVSNLGTYLVDGGVELASVQVPMASFPSGGGAAQGFYSLYVRNNINDVSVMDNNPGTNANQDNDFIVSLVSVGWVQAAGQVLAVKILEEEYAWSGVGQAPSAQKLKDSGGTSSAQFG